MEKTSEFKSFTTNFKTMRDIDKVFIESMVKMALTMYTSLAVKQMSEQVGGAEHEKQNKA